MAESQAVGTFGTLISVSTDGGSTYKKIPEVKNIGGPSQSAETVDVTHNESPDGYREYKGTLKDGGELTFDINFDPDYAGDANYLGSEAIAALLGDAIDWRITFPDATVVDFGGILTGFNIQPGDVAGALMASASIKITGPLAWT